MKNPHGNDFKEDDVQKCPFMNKKK